MSTVAEMLLARADDNGGGIRFEQQQWSWRQVVERSAGTAAWLAQQRRPGPWHVGVLLDNVPEFVFLLGGAALAGAVVVGINPTRRGAELERDIRHTDCQLIVTDADHAELLEGLDVPPIVSPPDATASPPSAPPGADELYLLLFTSGSTGAPKAVRMTQGRAARTATASAMAFTPRDVLYCAMPLFHGNALLANLFPAIAAGATVVLRRKFSASEFLTDVQQHGATFFNYVGRALSYIVAQPESPAEADNRLKWALGSEASPRDIAEFTRRYHCPIYEGYGSSENAVIIQPGPGMPPNAMGKPQQGLDVAVLHGDGSECAAAVFGPDGGLRNAEDAIGEIVGRNCAARFEGYYNNPEADAARARGDWYWSGDLGYRDAEGWFYFAGRSADWVRVDGENFAVAPVERILSTYPGASGVAVYGVPDEVTGDQLMAALEAPDFDPAQFASFLRGHPDLGTKWTPRYLRIVHALPTTGTRKVDKQPLRLEAWNTDDPIWWRPPRDSQYRPFTDADRAALRASFAAHGRGDQPSMSMGLNSDTPPSAAST